MRLVHALGRLAFGLGALGGMAATWAAAPSHCAELSRRLPNLTRTLCEQAALTAPGATSTKGVPLYQRDVLAPRPESVTLLIESKPAKPRRRVLVLGGIHGDELLSTSLVFHWIAHASDTAAEMDWRFVPARACRRSAWAGSTSTAWACSPARSATTAACTRACRW